MSRSTRVDLGRWEPSRSNLRSYRKYAWRSRAGWVNESEREILRLYREGRGIPEYAFDSLRDLGDCHVEAGTLDDQVIWSLVIVVGNVALYPLCAYLDRGSAVFPGKACWTRACSVTKQLGAKYLYTYEGYGPHGAYKGQSPGFEWWDGEVWSNNAEEYETLTRHQDVVAPRIMGRAQGFRMGGGLFLDAPRPAC